MRKDGTALESGSCLKIKEREGRKEMDDGQKLAVSSTMEEDGLLPGVSSCPARGHKTMLK
jgi:hypothetical protein